MEVSMLFSMFGLHRFPISYQPYKNVKCRLNKFKFEVRSGFYLLYSLHECLNISIQSMSLLDTWTLTLIVRDGY